MIIASNVDAAKEMPKPTKVCCRYTLFSDHVLNEGGSGYDNINDDSHNNN